MCVCVRACVRVCVRARVCVVLATVCVINLVTVFLENAKYPSKRHGLQGASRCMAIDVGSSVLRSEAT